MGQKRTIRLLRRPSVYVGHTFAAGDNERVNHEDGGMVPSTVPWGREPKFRYNESTKAICVVPLPLQMM